MTADLSTNHGIAAVARALHDADSTADELAEKVQSMLDGLSMLQTLISEARDEISLTYQRLTDLARLRAKGGTDE